MAEEALGAVLPEVWDMTVPQVVRRSFDFPLVIGHRGAASSRAENTVESFEEAIRCGVVGVECDVHVSQDGELMVIHDETLDRTTSLHGRVSETDSAVMRRAGVPTLAEYLSVTKDRALSVIEVKDGEGVVEKVLSQVEGEGMLEQTILFSFREDLLQRARGKAFTVRLSSQAPSLEGCDGIGVAYEAIDASLVQKAHRAGLPVFAWTVPPGDPVDRLRELEVNFVITNHPREVLEQLGR